MHHHTSRCTSGLITNAFIMNNHPYGPDSHLLMRLQHVVEITKQYLWWKGFTIPPSFSPTPRFRPNLWQANIADYGDNQWVTCFQESAEAILGQNAAYLGQLKDSVSLPSGLAGCFPCAV